jgi:NADPH-dependent 2,4-dienoyl-CoA reductase/sulfur reductase-like enzyme
LSTNKKKRIVIIGGVAAGTSAASKAKRIDPNAEEYYSRIFLWINS